jgi:hypothetical protein
MLEKTLISRTTDSIKDALELFVIKPREVILDLARLKWLNGVRRHVQWEIKRVATKAQWTGSSRRSIITL